jgi:hypothetical protein
VKVVPFLELALTKDELEKFRFFSAVRQRQENRSNMQVLISFPNAGHGPVMAISVALFGARIGRRPGDKWGEGRLDSLTKFQ